MDIIVLVDVLIGFFNCRAKILNVIRHVKGCCFPTLQALDQRL
jgi:hypothetical protein